MSKMQEVNSVLLQRHASIRANIHRAVDTQHLTTVLERMGHLSSPADRTKLEHLRTRAIAVRDELLAINNELHKGC